MGVLIAIPTAMIVTQPDLGTALLIAASGLIVMLLAGLQIKLILISIPLLGTAAWAAWHFIHDYQRQRILTFHQSREPTGSAPATTSFSRRSPSARAACSARAT
jgi:rod shape determining protein RodA